MNFWKPKEGLVVIKVLKPAPLSKHYMSVDTQPLCAKFNCPYCWFVAETKYERHELGRWADDGGR